MRKAGSFITEAISIRFLLAPLKLLVTILLIMMVLFVSSLITQSWFHQPALLEQELAHTQAIFEAASTPNDDFHIILIRRCYDTLYWFFFELTGLHELFVFGPKSELGQMVGDALLPHQDKIEILNQTLKIISIRMGNLFAYLPLLLCITITTVFDGLMQRKIRQQNAARESAGIYHRAKYWRTGMVWTAILVYLYLPISISPTWIMVPICLIGVLVFLQAKYLKKYL